MSTRESLVNQDIDSKTHQKIVPIESQKIFYFVSSKSLGHWWPKILKAKDDRKYIKALAAKKATYIKVSKFSINKF